MEKFVTTNFTIEWYDRNVGLKKNDSTNKFYRKIITVFKDNTGRLPKFSIHCIKMTSDDYCSDIKMLDPETTITTENEKKLPLSQYDVQNIISATIAKIFDQEGEYPECDKIKATIYNTSTNECISKIFYKNSVVWSSNCLNGPFSSLAESTKEFSQLVTGLLTAENIKGFLENFMTLKGIVTDILQSIKK